MWFNWGLVGAGLSHTAANVFTLWLNVKFTKEDSGLDATQEVTFASPMVHQNYWAYLKVGLPSIVSNALGHGSVVYLTTISGYLGIDQQA